MNTLNDSRTNQNFEPLTDTLRPVDRLDVISLQDNMVEMLCTTDKKNVFTADRWVPTGPEEHTPLPAAEHGFSLLIRIWVGESRHSLLFDSGYSAEGVLTNADILKLDLSEIEAIVLSHGHFDHWGGVPEILKKLGSKTVPLVLHPDMFNTRGIEENERITPLRQFPSQSRLEALGARIIRSTGPVLLTDSTVLVMGEVPRHTDFETGFAPGRIRKEGRWLPETEMADDRGLIIHVRNQGLVVISGCAHSGIVNNLHHARQLTLKKLPIHAVIGGFHLAGKPFEPRIEPTVKAVKAFNPAFVIPSHCTGWKAMYRFAQEMPDAFIHPSAGNLYRFERGS